MNAHLFDHTQSFYMEKGESIFDEGADAEEQCGCFLTEQVDPSSSYISSTQVTWSLTYTYT